MSKTTDEKIAKVRESIDTIATEEVKQLIDELDYLLWVKQDIEWRKKYGNNI